MIQSVLLFITGLTFFLFGMTKISMLMQQMISSRIRELIKISVKTPINGILMGISATVLLQSSSAATLLTMGIVSAGIISFYHSLSIILGADIGTTLTAQLVVWKFTTISPFIMFTGGILVFAGKDRQKIIGEAILYFGMIFFGLNLTGEATAPLKENETFLNVFKEAKHPLAGIGIGALFTGIVQASAIPVGILVIMGQQGIISIENAFPIVLGANIGTTVTALIGSTVLNVNGKKTAISHLIFKIAGVIVCTIFFPFFIKLIKSISSHVPQQVALSHFLFNVLITLMFGFLLRPFATLIEKIIPGKDDVIPLWPEYLNTKCLDSPEEALLCVQKELVREGMLSKKMFISSLDLIKKYKPSTRKDVGYIELIVDNLQLEITKYLWNVSCGQLSPTLSKRLFAFSTIVYDIERMGDHALNIVELAESKHLRKAKFSQAAMDEIDFLGKEMLYLMDMTISVIEKKDKEKINAIIQTADNIVKSIHTAIEKHLERFYQRICRAEAGPIFVDMLINLEGISRHCKIIAEQLKNIEY
ncbi:MAG: Na/Pi cotransporter family protein [Syntrophorhabdaceae bacterium]|nr:Na/Pi cotransporter family protein [Syntrophorhabdaceae bacterium]